MSIFIFDFQIKNTFLQIHHELTTLTTTWEGLSLGSWNRETKLTLRQLLSKAKEGIRGRFDLVKAFFDSPIR